MDVFQFNASEINTGAFRERFAEHLGRLTLVEFLREYIAMLQTFQAVGEYFPEMARFVTPKGEPTIAALLTELRKELEVAIAAEQSSQN